MKSFSFDLNIGIYAKDDEEALQIAQAIKALVEDKALNPFKLDYVDICDLEEC